MCHHIHLFEIRIIMSVITIITTGTLQCGPVLMSDVLQVASLRTAVTNTGYVIMPANSDYAASGHAKGTIVGKAKVIDNTLLHI